MPFPRRSFFASASRWFLALLWLGFFAWACDQNQGTNPTTTTDTGTCEYKGICTISYTHDPGGSFETTRVCQKDETDTRPCGTCWDLTKDSDDRISKKTCIVCRLCRKDFECIEDKDCKSATPICLQGVCRECSAHTDCKEEDLPYCQANTCVRCRTDRDCPDAALPQCHEAQCVACRCSGDKPHCQKLTDRTVLCVTCKTNADCALPTPACDATTFLCKAACTNDSDCQNGRFCTRGGCLECRTHDDCQIDLARPSCVEGTCGCKVDGDCLAPWNLCSSENRCVECRADADCPASTPRCLSGECQLKPCLTDQQCTVPGYQRCLTLVNRRMCVGCVQDSDCQNGQTCDTAKLTCK